MKIHIIPRSVGLVVFLLSFFLVGNASTSSLVPAYQVKFISEGYPTDIGPSAVVVGYENLSSPKPWVYKNGGKIFLPLGTEIFGQTTKISDNGVILGSVGNKPAVWEPIGDSYNLRILPLPADATGGQAAAIATNNTGIVVGNYSTKYVLPNGTAWAVEQGFKYDPVSNKSVPLSSIYGGGFSTVVDMTESGRILTREGWVLEPNTTTTTKFSNAGFVWTFFYASRINEKGEIVGIATLPTSQVNYQAVKYTPGLGWKVVGGTGGLVSTYDINNNGDVSYLGLNGCGTSAYQPEIYYEGFGTRCLDNLLVSGSKNWTTGGFPGTTFINDSLEVVSLGSNSATNQYGVILLSVTTETTTPPLPPPPVVKDVTAPSVTISQPSGTVRKGTITIRSTATDNVGVVKMEAFVDNQLVCTSDIGGFLKCSWFTGNTSRTVNLTVKAYDLAGNVGQTSKFIRVR